MSTAAEQYRALVDKLESIQQLNELAYGEEDPNNPGFMWVPSDGSSPLGDSSKQMIASGSGGYWNAKMVPINKPAPAPAPAEEPVGDITPRPPVNIPPEAEPEVAPTPTPTPTPTEPCGPEVKEKIKAQKTFNAAYAMAKQAGCPDFDWCQIVQVPGQGPMPSEPSPVTTNPMGDFDPTAFNGQAAARESIELEDGSYIAGDIELDRIREIAGTNVVKEAASAMPEIKASNKAAAIEIARKKGIKVFRFCGKYKVQDKKKGQGPTPAAPEKKVDYLGQENPLGGTLSNPMSFAPNSNFGA